MRSSTLIAAAILLAARPAGAEYPEPPLPPQEEEPMDDKDPLGRDVDFKVEVSVEQDDNVFHLTERQIEKIGTDGGSGRYRDMESATDLIVGAGAQLDLEMDAFAGRKTTLRIEPEAAVYLRNGRRSHAGVRASLIQKLWKHGEASMRFDATPGRFKRNYFAGGTDEDGDGDISGSERVYKAGVANETSVEAAVESRVAKPLSMRIEVGTAEETWNAPFRNRNKRAIYAGAGLEAELGKHVELGLDYELYSAASGAATETVLDEGAPRLTRVDRSYLSHEVSPSLKFELSKRIDLLTGASIRQRTYASKIADDPYRDRRDQRLGAAAGLRWSRKDIRLEAEYEYRVNETDRPNDPDHNTGDELDYVSNVLRVVLTARF